MTIDERWEQGIDHYKEVRTLLRLMNTFEEAYDLLECGGDGDPGETVMYILDELIDQGKIKIEIL